MAIVAPLLRVIIKDNKGKQIIITMIKINLLMLHLIWLSWLLVVIDLDVKTKIPFFNHHIISRFIFIRKADVNLQQSKSLSKLFH